MISGTNKSPQIKILALLLLSCLLFPAAGHAAGAAPDPIPVCAPPSPEKLLDNLFTLLARRKESHVEFREWKFLGMLTRPLESSGTLTYYAPDIVEKHVLAPHDESLLVHGDTLVLQHNGGSARLISLDDYPLVAAFVASARGILQGSLPSLERYYTVSASGGLSAWRICLVPKQAVARNKIANIRVAGSGIVLQQMDINQANGDTSRMLIRKHT